MITTDLSLAMHTKPLGHQKEQHTIFFSRRRQVFFSIWPNKQTIMRLCGYGAFLLMSVLSASFYPVAKPVLDRVDPALFLAAQMLWLLPPALLLLCLSRGRVSGKELLWGCGLGSGMSIALWCLTLAMTATSITETAIFSCLNGILVVLIVWLVFRQRVSFMSGLACLCSIAGMIVLFSVSEMHWVGDLLACAGGFLLTGHSFLIERASVQAGRQSRFSLRTVFGVELLTMVVEMGVYALIFGNWQSVHFLLPQDGATFAYLGLVTTFLPLVTLIVMRRYVNGVVLTFFGMLEPVAGAVFAFFFADERFLPFVYLGGALILGSLVLQALAGSIDALQSRGRLFQKGTPAQTQDTRMYGTRPQGRRAHALLAQLWSASEGVDVFTLQRATGIPYGCVSRLLALLQKRGYVVSYQGNRTVKRYMLHPSWHVSGDLRAAWSLYEETSFAA